MTQKHKFEPLWHSIKLEIPILFTWYY